MLRFRDRQRLLLSTVGAIVLAMSGTWAQDKIVLRSKQEIVGTIEGVSGKKVNIKLPSGVIAYDLAEIESVSMAEPQALLRGRGYEGEQRLNVLAPLAEQYAGLPVDWVIESMSLVADGYRKAGQAAKAKAMYEKMLALYPKSRYEVRAKAGLAQEALAAGRPPKEIMEMVAPLLKQASATVVPPPGEGAVYGAAYFVQGQAQEKLERWNDALTSYLTVVTLFFQDPSVAQAAQKAADDLRKRHPTAAVD